MINACSTSLKVQDILFFLVYRYFKQERQENEVKTFVTVADMCRSQGVISCFLGVLYFTVYFYYRAEGLRGYSPTAEPSDPCTSHAIFCFKVNKNVAREICYSFLKQSINFWAFFLFTRVNMTE